MSQKVCTRKLLGPRSGANEPGFYLRDLGTGLMEESQSHQREAPLGCRNLKLSQSFHPPSLCLTHTLDTSSRPHELLLHIYPSFHLSHLCGFPVFSMMELNILLKKKVTADTEDHRVWENLMRL